MATYDVFFCASNNQVLHVAAPESIAVWPTDPNWNDFGYCFRARARICPAKEDGQTLEVNLLVIPASDEPNAHRFDLWLEALEPRGGVYRAADLGRRFVSILRSAA